MGGEGGCGIMARVDRRRQLGLLFIVGVRLERLNPTIAREVPRYEQVPGRWGTGLLPQ